MTESSIPNTNTAPSQASKTLCYSLIHILLTLLATVRKPGSKTVPGKTLLGQRKQSSSRPANRLRKANVRRNRLSLIQQEIFPKRISGERSTNLGKLSCIPQGAGEVHFNPYIKVV